MNEAARPEPVITLYQWILSQFTLEGRVDTVAHLGPHLARLIRPGDRVLDLCCGTGPFAFFLEEHGAQVTAIDVAPFMIEHALEMASQRGSTVDFVQADILVHDLGTEQFDHAVFLGNTVSDFSLERFGRLAEKTHRALKRNGKFVVHYVDGLYQFIQGEYPREAVEQESPERITRRFKEYIPQEGAYVEVYRNEATGEVYAYTSYLCTPPIVRLALDRLFDLRDTIRLSERSFLDIFEKRQL